MPRRRGCAAGVIAALVLLAPVAWSTQADSDDIVQEQTLRKELVIAKSTASYEEARRVAGEAARRLGVPLELRRLTLHPSGKLTFPKNECEDNGWAVPCYVARGRFDDGFYVSIEHSSGYPEMKPNLYIVVVASGPRGGDITKRAERVAKTVFRDAYVRLASVYMGCIH